MFGKWILSAAFLLSGLGCAKPNYVQKNDLQNSVQQSLKADCTLQFNNSKLCLQIIWQDNFVVGQPTSAVLKVFRTNKFDDSPVPTSFTLSENETLSMVLWMPSMNHGSAPTKLNLPQLDTGTYLFTDIIFIMSGPWEIKFRHSKDGQVVDEAVVNIDVF